MELGKNNTQLHLLIDFNFKGKDRKGWRLSYIIASASIFLNDTTISWNGNW